MHIFSKYMIGIGLTFLSQTSIANETYKLPPSSTSVRVEGNTEQLKEMSQALEKLAGSAKKGLVFISVSKTIETPHMVDPFEFFFGPQFRDRHHRRKPKQQPKQEGFGSGFFVDLKKGYILTNNHVVDKADEITLKLSNGKSYKGEIIGQNEDTDIAVIKVSDQKFSRKNLSELILEDSEKVSIGAPVVALGAPFLLEASVSFGIVSAVGRGNLKLTKMGNFIQTDAAINPGNSGGPLISMDGKVIGINSAIFSKTGAYAGIGFAIPSNLARRVAQSLINEGSFYRGFIGISYNVLEEQWISPLGLPKDTKGIIISSVLSGGAADKADLRAKDVIVALDGKDFDPENLANEIGRKEPGTRMNLTVYRRDEKNKKWQKVHVNVTVGTSPDAKKQKLSEESSKKGKDSYILDHFGLLLRPLDKDLKSRYELSSKKGLVILKVESLSTAWRVGFEEGDLIVSVNGEPVNSIEDFEKIAKSVSKDKKKSEPILLQIERKGSYYFRALEGNDG